MRRVLPLVLALFLAACSQPAAAHVVVPGEVFDWPSAQWVCPQPAPGDAIPECAR